MLSLYSSVLSIKENAATPTSLIVPSITILHIMEQAYGMLPFKSSEETHSDTAIEASEALGYIHKEHKHRV